MDWWVCKGFIHGVFPDTKTDSVEYTESVKILQCTIFCTCFLRTLDMDRGENRRNFIFSPVLGYRVLW